MEEGGRVAALVDPWEALLQVGLPEGPQAAPRPRRMWQRGAPPSPLSQF